MGGRALGIARRTPTAKGRTSGGSTGTGGGFPAVFRPPTPKTVKLRSASQPLIASDG